MRIDSRRQMISLRSSILVPLVLLWISTNLCAQTSPTILEIEEFSGLHKAAYYGDVESINRLVEMGADLETQDNAGRTPLHVAAFASRGNAVRALVLAGANLNALENDAYDILTIAAVANDLELLDLAISLGANTGNITSRYDGTALIAAAHLGHHRVVKSLILGGAPLDHINNLGWTALMEAVVLGDGGKDHIETVRLLVSSGADRNIPDNGGIKPLEHALAREFKEIAALLDGPDKQ